MDNHDLPLPEIKFFKLLPLEDVEVNNISLADYVMLCCENTLCLLYRPLIFCQEIWQGSVPVCADVDHIDDI